MRVGRLIDLDSPMMQKCRLQFLDSDSPLVQAMMLKALLRRDGLPSSARPHLSRQTRGGIHVSGILPDDDFLELIVIAFATVVARTHDVASADRFIDP